MYVIVRDDAATGIALLKVTVAANMADAVTLLSASKLEFPRLESRIMKLVELDVHEQLQGSLRITEVKNA